MLPPAVLWVDPGLMTGFALLCNPPGPWGSLWVDEWDFPGACGVLESICISYQQQLAVGWERFTVTGETHKKTPQPDALHFIGVCRLMSLKYRCRVLPEAQQATPSKSEQEQLKALGWWVPSKDDAQSAAAHLLRWLQRTGELPPREREILNAIGRQDTGNGD